MLAKSTSTVVRGAQRARAALLPADRAALISVRRSLSAFSATPLAADGLLCVASLLMATYLRYEFHLTIPAWREVGILLVVVIFTLLLAGSGSGLYTGHWQSGSFEEARAVAFTTAVVAGVTFLSDLALGRPLPLGAVIAAAPMTCLAVVALRFVTHARAQQWARPEDGGAGSRVVIFGAGDGAARVIAAMLRHPTGGYVPVALLDDDPAKRRLRLHGIPVQGDREALPRVTTSSGADTLLIAIPSANAELIRDIADRADALSLRVRVLPSVSELFDGHVKVEDIRAVSYADLLGRREVEIDISSVASYLTGRRVLVTGAGGSIGSELCRQVERFAPATIIMLDRDESALHGVQLSMTGRALLDDPSLVVADIRDRQRLSDVFTEHRPQVVFHAAALKHLPMLQMHPDEAVKTNVWGTWNILEAAAAAGVSTFVNISTDKAADPVSVLGYTKRMAERLTAWFSLRHNGDYLSVRFGNVLGSRGSVLTTFGAQIAGGGPVTVTDPDVTRFFMTVEEAVRLVIQAGAVASDGEALVLDMGQPVRIADVARRLVGDAGKAIDIVYTGLRQGEKLHEALLAHDEADRRPLHPLISHVAVPPLSPASVRGVDLRQARDELIAWCRSMSGSSERLTNGNAFSSQASTVDLVSRFTMLTRRASDAVAHGGD